MFARIALISSLAGQSDVVCLLRNALKALSVPSLDCCPIVRGEMGGHLPLGA